MKLGNAERAQLSMCQEWNKTNPPSCDVIVALDDQSEVKTRTRGAAFMLGRMREYPGHTAVIALEGISSCYSLDRVRAQL